MPADSQAQPPRFRLWLRRQGLAEGAFSLRFEVEEGKGVLRVTRPGVLIDPPARAVGVEERLSGSQLRSTRFILVWDGGRSRQGHLFSRLEDVQIDRMQIDEWQALEIVAEGAFRYAALPVSAEPPPVPEPPPPSAPDARFSAGTAFFASFSDAQEEDAFSVDLPTHRQSTEHVTVRGAAAESEEVEVEDAEEALEAGEDDQTGEDDGEAAPAPSAPMGLRVRPVTVRADAASGREPDPWNPEGEGEGPIHRDPWSLVRHLRRKEARHQARIEELEAQVLELHARLAAEGRRG